MSDTLKPIAKAIAALIVPFVIAGLDELAEKAGINIPVEASLVDTVVVAAVSAVVVWVVRNQPKTT